MEIKLTRSCSNSAGLGTSSVPSLKKQDLATGRRTIVTFCREITENRLHLQTSTMFFTTRNALLVLIHIKKVFIKKWFRVYKPFYYYYGHFFFGLSNFMPIISIYSGTTVNTDTKGTRQSVRIIGVSVLSGFPDKKVTDTCFSDEKTISGIFLR